jgi:ATP-dependent helicase/nuclease subunit A
VRSHVIADHKSFPGRLEKWTEKALQYAPQPALYREATEKATVRPVVVTIIHMPLLGLRLHCRANSL